MTSPTDTATVSFKEAPPQPDERVRVPIGEIGRHVSVPKLKLYFEQKISEHQLSPSASPASSSSSGRGGSPKVAEQVQRFEEKEAEDEESPTSPLRAAQVEGEEKVKVASRAIKPRVRWRKQISSGSSAKDSVGKIDLEKIPSYQELQDSLSPRGAGKEKEEEVEPPLIRRDVVLSSSWSAGFKQVVGGSAAASSSSASSSSSSVPLKRSSTPPCLSKIFTTITKKCCFSKETQP